MADRVFGLDGLEVAITGRLASMSRDRAVEQIGDAGGRFVATPTAQTSMLVVGQYAPLLGEDGHLTRSLDRAHQLQHQGRPIRIIPEDEFLYRLGLQEWHESVHRLYTTAQLARILDIPLATLRAWVRNRLIQPARVVRRLCFFDFRQVAIVRALHRLVSSGASATKLRRTLDQLAAWLPDADRAVLQLERLESQGPVLVRLDDGRLAEPSGQLWLDYESSSEDRAPPPHSLGLIRNAEEWIEAGLAAEADGDPEGAVKAYEQALNNSHPQPEVCFNLGNVLFDLGLRERAADRFRQAIQLEPHYVEAWNNLGSTLFDLGRFDEAVDAFENALEIEPTYADAHFNLGEAMASRGRIEDARAHWLAYLAQDPHSAWADSVRQRLEELRNL